MNISRKALQALHNIATDNRAAVTSQMIDRLDRDGLIEFDLSVNPDQGWYVTDAGRGTLGVTA